MQTQQFNSDDQLNLFQSSHRFNSSPVLDKGISLINNMIELDYIKFGNDGLQFTDSGIEYMLNKWNEFSTNGANIDLSMAFALSGAKQAKPAHNMLKEFKHANLIIDINVDEVDYNNATFKKEYNASEPGVDGI
jgi:hypothetical protein